MSNAGDLPLWARVYIRGTRFYDAHRDQWFAVFEPATEQCQYSSRRAAIVDKLGALYSRDDVVKVGANRFRFFRRTSMCTAYEGVLARQSRQRARQRKPAHVPTSTLQLSALIDGPISSTDGVVQIAKLLRSGASDDTLAAAWVPLVCSRLVAGGDVPPNVTKAARACLNTPADILRYNAGAAEVCLPRGAASRLLPCHGLLYPNSKC